MILVSCRASFDHDRRFAADNAFRNYPNLAKLGRYQTLDAGGLAEEVRGKHVLILIHGYRNPIGDVGPAYARIEKGLRRHALLGPAMYGIVLGFLWPGFRTVLGFFPAVPAAGRAAAYFRRLLVLLKGTAHTIDVQTHSLGARVALQAMAFPGEVFVDNLLLSAPAVDNECLEPRREFHDSLESCRRCFVYHSSKDGTLRYAYPVAARDRALGCEGPQHPDVIRKKCPEVFVVDCQRAVKSHGGYRSAERYYRHWAKVLHEEPIARFSRL